MVFARDPDIICAATQPAAPHTNSYTSILILVTFRFLATLRLMYYYWSTPIIKHTHTHIVLHHVSDKIINNTKHNNNPPYSSFSTCWNNHIIISGQTEKKPGLTVTPDVVTVVGCYTACSRSPPKSTRMINMYGAWRQKTKSKKATDEQDGCRPEETYLLTWLNTPNTGLTEENEPKPKQMYEQHIEIQHSENSSQSDNKEKTKNK